MHCNGHLYCLHFFRYTFWQVDKKEGQTENRRMKTNQHDSFLFIVSIGKHPKTEPSMHRLDVEDTFVFSVGTEIKTSHRTTDETGCKKGTTCPLDFTKKTAWLEN